jgi:PPK2 family polyphosphate:nucleotide phosphotransferase
MEFDMNKFLVKPGKKIKLEHYDPKDKEGFDKETSKEMLKQNKKELNEIQDLFYADDRYSLLIILQASDAAGKDGAIRHVFGGINPQGCRVHSFKAPAKHELEHDFMWRHYIELPERGMIEIFNRSYYENVLVTKVHPGYLIGERIPGIDKIEDVSDKFWEGRYQRINDFESHLYQSGTRIIKFFLNLSKKEQKKRFLQRLEAPEKNWKFSSADLKERKYWNEYRQAFEDMINKTSTDIAPWYIIPADNKWLSRMAIGKIIYATMKSFDMCYPKAESPEVLEDAKKALENED